MEHDLHPQGTCWANHRDKAVFVNIPKNASTSVKNYLKHNGYHEDNFKQTDFSDYYVFAIIRHPVTRFLSAVVTYVDRHGLQSRDIDLLLKEMSHDPHVERQAWFLDGIEVNYYCLFELLPYSLIRLKNIVSPNIIYISHDNTIYMSAKEEVFRAMSIEQWQRLYDKYEADFRLWEAVPRLNLEGQL